MARCLHCGVEIEDAQALYCSRCRAFVGSGTTASGSSASGSDDFLSHLVPARNTPALVGYYLGVFSLIPCLGAFLALFALGLGITGLRKAREVEVGRVHAIVAIVLGSLSLLAHLLCIAGGFVALGSG
ncbi:MAG: hypothetical protein ACK4RG_09010 [Fimbriimonadales bacterium]